MLPSLDLAVTTGSSNRQAGILCSGREEGDQLKNRLRCQFERIGIWVEPFIGASVVNLPAAYNHEY